jgi:hypothetical protein
MEPVDALEGIAIALPMKNGELREKLHLSTMNGVHYRAVQGSRSS